MATIDKRWRILLVFDSKNAVILSFPAFSGGKFLSNCLSLSKDACPQDPKAAEYLLNAPDDYDYRSKTILQTLPPEHKMKNWRHFEFGDLQLYGDASLAWRSGISQDPGPLVKKICDSGMKFFICDHSMEPISLLSVWKNATVIRLINSRRFQDLCLAKKTHNFPEDRTQLNGNYCIEKYEYCRGPDWPDWEEFERYGYDINNFSLADRRIVDEIGQFYRLHSIKNQVLCFDVDQNYFDVDKFLKAIQCLYEQLGLTDFSAHRLEFFYKKYMSLHF